MAPQHLALLPRMAALGVQSVTNGFLWGLLTQKVPVEAPVPEGEPARV